MPRATVTEEENLEAGEENLKAGEGWRERFGILGLSNACARYTEQGTCVMCK